MKYAISQQQRYELATKIGFFLLDKGLKTWETWQGRLTKNEQMETFGFYMGKGLITVDGQSEEIIMSIKVCFGQDIYDSFYASAKDGCCHSSNKKLPINELGLYCPLN